VGKSEAYAPVTTFDAGARDSTTDAGGDLQTPATPEIVCDDDDAIIATWRGHVLALWHGASTVAAAERLERVALDCTRKNPGRVAYLALINASVPLPDAGARAVYARLGRQLGTSIACISVVLEGRGFVASAMRAAVTGIGLAARISFPLACFAELDEAASWASQSVARRGGVLGSVSEVRAAFAAMRQRRQRNAAPAGGYPRST
jgi:hypothetical protein